MPRVAFEADSFFAAEGKRPRIGQAFIVIDPGAPAGADVHHEHIVTLVAALLAEVGVRLPGARRPRLAVPAVADGIEISESMVRQLRELARAS